MVALCSRIQFYEIADQEWFPSYLREKFQSCLAIAWTLKIPFIQTVSPAQLVARILFRVLEDAGKYRYVDFCAGAGGPTPTIERELNLQLESKLSSSRQKSPVGSPKGVIAPAQFVLTDLHPHFPEWTKISKKADNITFIPESVDATSAPLSVKSSDEQKIFRLFNLSFHHFDDKLASGILRNSLETADGLGIFEIGGRTFPTLLAFLQVILILFLVTPFYFWRSPGHLFFTYIIPIIPLALLFDGFISCLRMRTSKEILDLVEKCGTSLEDWRIQSGEEYFLWPLGYVSWTTIVKKNTTSK